MKIDNKFCPKCNTKLKTYKGKNGYAYTCKNCDEDFYEFEANIHITDKEKRIVSVLEIVLNDCHSLLDTVKNSLNDEETENFCQTIDALVDVISYIKKD